jgi:ribose 5-phosphate isomerase B
MIYLGADHGGYELKEKIKEHLRKKGMEFEDLGSFSKDSVDYPVYAFAVAEKVRNSDSGDIGILACTTSIGTSVAANKVKGIRAAVGYSEEATRRARNDLDANVLCLGGEMDHEQALRMVDIFLNTPFSQAERHVRRISMIAKKEEEE